ncbi:MAG: rubrerythrin [Rhodospirillaceae bacterium]|nr:MAG: rubrerythrin [Rhodospirillaceae bacterium]
MTHLSIADFLAHAIALEADAALCYDELAAAMDVHNNRAVTALFQQMASYARHHLAEVEAIARNYDVPRLKSWEFDWKGRDTSPEQAAMEEAHYLMTPYQALQMALAAEEQAFAYYDGVRTRTNDPVLQNLATQLATEEAEHVRLVRAWLDRSPPPAADWDHDPDPPVSID